MIPEQAVEAAAKYLHDIDCRSAVHSGYEADFECYDWMTEAKELLEAAAPYMLAGDEAKLAAIIVLLDPFERAASDEERRRHAFDAVLKIRALLDTP